MRMLIFGAGRVGASLARYAAELGHAVAVVSRDKAVSDRAAVAAMLGSADLVAAAIPDDRIAQWRSDWAAEIGPKTAIHFSGALTFDGLRGYHPLYSFPADPLPPEIMGRIAIAREEGAPAFSSILPGAGNPEFVVAAADRSYYHALAVLSGNFAAHLWNEAAKGFAARFSLPPEEILGSYLAGVVDRFRESPFDSLTGPIARRDVRTVAANLAALAGEPRLSALYQAFLDSAWPERPGPIEKAR